MQHRAVVFYVLTPLRIIARTSYHFSADLCLQPFDVGTIHRTKARIIRVQHRNVSQSYGKSFLTTERSQTILPLPRRQPGENHGLFFLLVFLSVSAIFRSVICPLEAHPNSRTTSYALPCVAGLGTLAVLNLVSRCIVSSISVMRCRTSLTAFVVPRPS